MGKKKFIDKRKAATFTLVYRESEADDSTDAPPRVFTRVDGGEGFVKGFSDSDPRFYGQSSEYASDNGDGRRDAFGEVSERDELNSDRNNADNDDSRFDDADDESGEEDAAAQPTKRGTQAVAFPRDNPFEEKRRELIELGFPDDGYDYLQHLRKIGTVGVGGAFVPAARIDTNALRADVKAYDATKVQVQPRDEDSKEGERRAIELVSSRTHLVRKPLSKEGVLDADVVAALEDSDGSQFDSADELEDEFVILANDGVENRSSSANGASASGPYREGGRGMKHRNVEEDIDDDESSDVDELSFPRKERPARFLDEQFETLALREYDDDEFGELDEDDPTTRGHADISEFSSVLSEFLTEKVHLKERYESPAEENKKEVLSSPLPASEALRGSLYKDPTSSMIIHSGVDDVVVKKTLEYTSDDDDRELVLEAASDDEKEHWDCETVVSTLSNLDNHPGKIRAPGPLKPRIKLQDVEKSETGIIRLGGKQKLPLDYLPKRALAPVKEEAKPVSSKTASSLAGKKGGPRVGETAEEKKARKASIKEERKEARVGKKALKLMYRQDALRAQHGAAVTGPSSIHLA